MTKLIYTLVFCCASFAHSAPLSWPKDAVATIQKARTFKDIACASHGSVASEELCALYKKDFNVKPKFKLEMPNDSSLELKSGGMTVRLERTDLPFQFMVNGQMIDLNKYPNQERLGFAIEAALAPRGANWPSLLDGAYAAGIDPSLKIPIQGLMKLSGEKVTCATYKEFIATCVENSDPIFTYLKDNVAAHRSLMDPGMKKTIAAKLDAIGKALARADGQVNARYGSALSCDCDDNVNQVACTPAGKAKTFGVGRDVENMTEPRQKGMDKCQRLINEVGHTTEVTGLTAKTANDLLTKIDQNILNIKQE
ncbi:MAG: hypothetical protein ACXVA9_12265, partial [Bdellovibrionales bacterium]